MENLSSNFWIIPLYLLSNLSFLFNLVCTPCTPLLSNCNKYKVKAVNINLQYADDEKIKDIRKDGIKIFWAVENDFEEYKSKYLGDGVVSDWITEDEICNLIDKD